MFSARAALRLSGQLKPASGINPTRAIPACNASFKLSLDRRRYISAYGYTQAKALVYSNYGEPKDVLSLHSYSISPPHNTQVNVRLLTAPLNPADINQIQGVYPSKPTFTTALGTSTPSTIGGNEAAFEVISTGSGVKTLTKGDWVIMKRTGMGTWRTHAQFDEASLIKIEDRSNLTPLQVGTVGVNPVTAYRMLKDFCEWDWVGKPGEEWAIQNGANSGVGRAVIQLAREWGIKTLNVIRERDTPAETEALKNDLLALGATAVVTESQLLSSKTFREIVHEVTRQGKEPIRLALNCVGGSSATAMLKVLAPDSRMVTYGAMAKQPLTLPSGLLIFKNLVLNGFWVSKWSDKNPSLKTDTVNDILRLTRAGKFKDIPVQEVKWRWETGAAELAGEVQGTLSGKRSGKSVFVYEGD
ncbi:mitochondrial trans-2-enoyl-CoA reductase [[Emmonsia] crescens]|uniref:enoyl-[acyl-carrier-protein] reductase n=1 Tax=[Emmonsia] crescens TaxID=73230 RepID=A0A2B7ZDW3_9EURO|nr:mitochondrial trans-2-enoyl-CoA reductase [Emmonsia crescens]